MRTGVYRWSMKSALLGNAALIVGWMGLTNVALGDPQQQVLPAPSPFKGKIGKTYQESVTDKIPLIKAPPGRPNPVRDD